MRNANHEKTGAPGKRSIVRLLSIFLSIAAASAPGQTQEIFDLLRKGDVAAVKALVDKTPALVDARDANGWAPLHYAAVGPDPGLIDFLIGKGAKLELKESGGATPLHLAARRDNRVAVEALVKRGAPLEAKDDYQRTPLVLCARERGQASTARVLIEAGADVNAVDKFGDTAVSLAAWRGKAELIDLLLEKGAKLPSPGERWWGMVSLSASQGLTTLFKRLTEGAPDLKAAGGPGNPLLQAAAAGGSAEIVQALLDKGFEAARADRFGWTPLHYAARDGRTEAARILTDKGAPMDVRTIMGQTPYNVARERKMDAVAAMLAEKGADTSGIRFPELKGDYLGQAPPGDQPKLFAPGIVSSIWGLHSTAVFSPDGNEVWWAPMIEYPGEIYSRGGLLMMKRVGGRWAPPVSAPFSGPDSGDDVPFFSGDGKRVYFISGRLLPGEKEVGERICFADRAGNGWSEPKPLDPAVNEHDKHWSFSLDRSGNLYFGGEGTDSRGMSDIFVARFVKGKYERPANLGDPINTPGGETTPFVAPDGSYLLFSRQYDLWVSFRGPGGTWAEPVRFGPGVNSESIELCPMVTADGKYLFFLSQRDGESHAYWVSAAVIEKLRPVRTNAQTKTGDVVVGTAYAYPSTYLKSDVPVSIHLPRGYDGSGARHPVLYMLDFGNDFVFAGPVADFLAASHRIPGLIVVAVAVDRLSGPPQAMLDFLEKELFPSVEKTYRTEPCRLLYGHSGRSFAALFIMLNRPELFYAYICPGLGLMDPPMPGAVDFPALASAKLSGLSSFPKAFYFSLGDERPFIPGVEKLMEVFRTKAPRDFEWKFAHMEADDHISTKLKTLYEGLEFAFSGMNLPLDVAQKGVEAVKDHYDKLGRKLGFPIVLSEPPMAQMVDDAIVRIAAYQKQVRPALALLDGMKRTMGYPGISESSYGLIGSFSLNAGGYEDAAAAYEAMAAAYPGSASARNGLGEAHEKLGRLDLAVEDFEAACALGRKSGSPRLSTFESNLARVRKALGK